MFLNEGFPVGESVAFVQGTEVTKDPACLALILDYTPDTCWLMHTYSVIQIFPT